MDTFGTLKEILAPEFQVPAELITTDTREDADLDSLLAVELSLVLERETGVVVSHHNMHDTNTVGEMADLIAKRASSPRMTRAPFSTVAVIGLGTVGSAFTRRLSDAGLSVIAIETGDASLERGLRRVARGAAGGGPGLCNSTDLAQVATAELVIEAVPERPADKCTVLRRAHGVCGPDTILAKTTTTTALSVAALGSVGGRADRTVGLHLPRPAASSGVAEFVGTTCHRPRRPGPDDPPRGSARVGAAGGRRPLRLPCRRSADGLAQQRRNDARPGYAIRVDINDAMRLGCGLPSRPAGPSRRHRPGRRPDTVAALHARSGRPHYAPALLLEELVRAGRLGRRPATDSIGTRLPTRLRNGRTVGRVSLRHPDQGGPVGRDARGIAQAWVTAGCPTVLAARSPAKAEVAAAGIRELLRRNRRRARPEDAERLITCGSGLDVVGGCDLVIEAAAEDLTVERQVFAGLAWVTRPGAALASTTSRMPVAEVAGRRTCWHCTS